MTVAPALISMFASGLPTVRPLPITTTCFPFNSVCDSARTIQARGVAGAVKNWRGSFCASAPRFAADSPSTSLFAGIRFVSSISSNSGLDDITRMTP